MALSLERAVRVVRVGRMLLAVVATLLLAAATTLVLLERGWAKPPPQARLPHDAFWRGPIGTELAPLVMVQVLPDMFPEHFQPLGRDKGDWVEQFGFIRRPADEIAKDPDAQGLPLGFVSSNYRPQSGAPTRVRFTGFACVLCHSTRIRDESGTDRVVVGTGNSALNLFGWLDAFQAAVLDEKKLTVGGIDEAYRRRPGTGRPLSLEEKLVVGMWLRSFRATMRENVKKFDEPFGDGRSLDPDVVPTGPGRTQPFRTLLRRVLERPGANMHVFTKIAPVYHEDWREWAQVDGSVKDLYVRSSLAVLAAGATLDNMMLPEVRDNIRAASDYTRALKGPTYSELFPRRAGELDTQAVERGRQLFATSCATCHGQPEPSSGEWVRGPRQGEVIPVTEVGTDAERVLFRYNDRLPDELFKHFQAYPLKYHPFRFPRETLRPGPLGEVRGYVCGPLDSIATRAPYGHNASVLTLAEWINLKPRRQAFYRDRNAYDPEGVGLEAPDMPNSDNYFRYDTSVRGNSNKGHDYPWPYKGEGWNENALKDLLQYIKSAL